MSTRTEKTQLLESIYEWQTERELESWNTDQIKFELGVTLVEDHEQPVTLISEDGQVEVVFKEIAEEFKEGKYGGHTLTRKDSVYSISKTVSKKESKGE